MKKEFILLGPPACGKGTQTGKLAHFFSLPHVDTGSLLRAEIKKGSDRGIIAKKFIDKGQLVPVELVGGIIKSRLKLSDCDKGFILDGFPRSIEQANMLEDIISEIDYKIVSGLKAVYFETNVDTLLSRIVNRRSCSKCGEIYNLKYKAPKNEGICDKCGGLLIQRQDDNEATAYARLDTYNKETAPLVDYYKSKNVLVTIDANGAIDEVWDRLLKAVK